MWSLGTKLYGLQLLVSYMVTGEIVQVSLVYFVLSWM